MQQISKRQAYLILCIIIAVQLAGIIYAFTKKENCHSDELWSYGYANFYYGGDIYNTELMNKVYRDEWIDSTFFKDYLTVDTNERFKYDSVYFNMKNGEHPPLHSMLLHTICSFFPGKFSLWYSFSINIVAFVLCMIFMFKLGSRMKNDCFALLCCGIYGFSLGARDTFIYLRMYALCAAELMIILYNAYVIITQYEKEQKISRLNLMGLFISCFFAFYTHFYMIAFMGMLTFFLCIYFLAKRYIKLLFIFGGSVMSALVFMLAAFPNTISRVIRQISELHSEKRLNYNFSIRLRMMLDFVCRKEFGFPVSIYKSGWIPIIAGCVIYGCIVMLPLCYMCRSTKWMTAVKAKCKYVFTHKRIIWKKWVGAINWSYVLTVLVFVLQLIIVGATVNMYLMGKYVDRYIHYLYPLAVLIMLRALDWICHHIFHKTGIRKAVTGLVVCALLFVNVQGRTVNDDYFFLEPYEGKTLASCVKDENVIVLGNSRWRLVCLSDKMMESKSFFRVYEDEYTQYTEEYCEKLKEGPLILVVDVSGYEGRALNEQRASSVTVMGEEKRVELSEIEEFVQMTEYFKNIEQDIIMEKLSEQIVFNRHHITYRISRR